MNNTDYASRQRVLDALNHREPDRIPFDFGATPKTGITIEAYDRFIEFEGLVEEPDGAPFDFVRELSGSKQVPENILRHLKVDTRALFLNLPAGVEPSFEIENGTMVVYDEWGIKWAKPESSYYIDPVENPLKGKLTRQRLTDFSWPDPLNEGRFAGLREYARQLRSTGCAVLIEPYPLGIFETAQWLHGLEDTLADMALEPGLMEDLFDRITTFQMQIWEKLLETVEDNIDVCIHADDLGGQTGPIISPEMYRTLLKPRHAQLFEHIRKAAGNDVRIMLHSCGSVRALIPDFIEIGIDALNPIQVSATGMGTRELKREFGQDLCFWGGGIDTQHMLPLATTAEVRDEIKRRIDDLAPSGGFVFATVNPVQPDVPPENIRAMWEAFQEHCRC